LCLVCAAYRAIMKGSADTNDNKNRPFWEWHAFIHYQLFIRFTLLSLSAMCLVPVADTLEGLRPYEIATGQQRSPRKQAARRCHFSYRNNTFNWYDAGRESHSGTQKLKTINNLRKITQVIVIYIPFVLFDSEISEYHGFEEAADARVADVLMKTLRR